jgi:hypothetical protein
MNMIKVGCVYMTDRYLAWYELGKTLGEYEVMLNWIV